MKPDLPVEDDRESSKLTIKPNRSELWARDKQE
jgi:hypothetical protein